MSLWYGVLLAAVGFVAYYVGHYRGLHVAGAMASVLLREMDKDMDGAVKAWFDAKQEVRKVDTQAIR